MSHVTLYTPFSYMWHDSFTNVTYSYVWHDSFSVLILCIPLSYMWHDSFTNVTYSYVWRYSFTCKVTRHKSGQPSLHSSICDSHMCDMTHPRVWHIHMCDMTHSRVKWHTTHQVDSLNSPLYAIFICVTWLIHVCDMTQIDSCVTWRDWFIYVTWLIYMCDVTHSRVKWHALNQVDNHYNLLYTTSICVPWLITLITLITLYS